MTPIESGTSSNGNQWQKRSIVLAGEGEYPKDAAFTQMGDKCNEEVEVGAKVEISFNIESRQYNGKWYTDLKAWRVKVLEKPSGVNYGAADDLPFA